LAADRAEAGASAALDDRFDDAWELWENTLCANLAARLGSAGATVVDSREHISAAARLTALVGQFIPDPDISVESAPVPDDQHMVARILRQTRLRLSPPRPPAQIITLDQDVALTETVRVAEATTRVDGRPNLVLNARLSTRLAASYSLPERKHVELRDAAGPVLVTRTIADDGTGTETDAVWLVRLCEPAAVTRLAEAWNGRGDLICCVAVSCLIDQRWRASWLLTLERTAPLVWLIDVPIETLAGEFGSGRTVRGVYVDLKAHPTGARQAVAFKVLGKTGVWVAVADEVGVELITRQVADLPGIDLRMTGADWTQALPAVRLVLLDLLRTEPYLDLRALSHRQG
jgi:hypothetical protein